MTKTYKHTEIVKLKAINGRTIKVLKGSLNHWEISFLNAGNEVEYDPARHVKYSKPRNKKDVE